MDVLKFTSNLNDINDDDIVRVTKMGNIIEVMYSEKISIGGKITKIDKDSYVLNDTGEVFEFKKMVSRADDKHNVAKSLKVGRDIINTNVVNVDFCRWVTLTYKENMTDPKKLGYDFNHCIKRLRSIFGHFEYITAAEPQGRGAWHLHCLFIFSDRAPFIPNDVLSKAWKKGFVRINRLDNIDNVGVYLTAYLGDIELTDDSDIEISKKDYVKDVVFNDPDGNQIQKKYIKGARLHLYPPGMHIFRYSKGIQKPEVDRMTYDEARKLFNNGKLTYESSMMLVDDESGYSNNMKYEYYNLIKKDY